MALITEIRKQFWLILVLLGLALAAFIMMDAQSFGNNSAGNTTMGEVAGTKIDYMDFQNAQSAMFSNSSQDVYSTRNTLWNHFVEKAIVEKEADALGIKITDEMLDEMKNGTRLSPVVQGFFSGQNGQFDQNFYNNFKQQLDAGQLNQQAVNQWNYLDNFIVKDQLQSQISNMASKAVYTPTWMAEILSKDQKTGLDYAQVKIPFDQVTEPELTNADLTAYLNKNKSNYFNKEESRVIEYLELTAVPTEDDIKGINNELERIKGDWAKIEDDSIFVLNNDGFYPAAYTKDAGLPTELKDIAYGMTPGEIHGPYKTEVTYNLVKLLDRKEIPDSVNSRHILIKNITTQEAAVAASTLLDSLKNLLETGQANFGDLARAHSMDGSATAGGELGMSASGRMVGPFNDLLFYTGKQGKYYTIASQFGLHLVELTGKKFVAGNNRTGLRLVYIPMAIIPSETTQKSMLSQANRILDEVNSLDELKTYAQANGFLVKTAEPFINNSHIINGLNPGQNSRDITQWAYLSNTKTGEISPVVHVFDNEQLYYNEKFIIAGLESIQPKGYLPLASVKDDIRAFAMNDKKAATLKSSLAGKSLAAIAEQYGTKIDTIQGATFSSTGKGESANIISQVLKGELNQVSGPLVGESGIFYYAPLAKNEPATVNDISIIRTTTGFGTKNSMNSKLIQSLKDASEIEDSRATFF